MDTIFTLGDESSDKIKMNLDELYEKKTTTGFKYTIPL